MEKKKKEFKNFLIIAGIFAFITILSAIISQSSDSDVRALTPMIYLGMLGIFITFFFIILFLMQIRKEKKFKPKYIMKFVIIIIVGLFSVIVIRRTILDISLKDFTIINTKIISHWHRRKGLNTVTLENGYKGRVNYNGYRININQEYEVKIYKRTRMIFILREI